MKLWQVPLLALTPAYAAVVRARAAAYRRGLLRVHRLPLPVVSVGNLVFGGTGKTPVVMALARELVRRGRKPAVLTRGYGRRVDVGQVTLIGPDTRVDPAVAGDEPAEMALRLPGVPIVVDADRVRGGERARSLGADVLLLDDGFQHLRLGRDLDLVLVDAGDPWGGGRLPPRGRLREPLSALRRACAVMVTKLPPDAQAAPEAIMQVVQRWAPCLPVFASSQAVRRVCSPGGIQPPDVLARTRVFAFAGLGRPEGFRDLLVAAGAEVVGHRWYADHHRFTPDDLDQVQEEARRADALPVTTGKDAVKLPEGAEVWVVEAEVEPAADTWSPLLELCPALALPVCSEPNSS